MAQFSPAHVSPSRAPNPLRDPLSPVARAHSVHVRTHSHELTHPSPPPQTRSPCSGSSTYGLRQTSGPPTRTAPSLHGFLSTPISRCTVQATMATAMSRPSRCETVRRTELRTPPLQAPSPSRAPFDEHYTLHPFKVLHVLSRSVIRSAITWDPLRIDAASLKS